jgi:uncharacterized protein YndB with AHSA1/START domain
VITHSVEIARTPEEVFAYLDQLDRHGEWQERLVSARVETPGPVGVGTRAVEKRRVPGGQREFTYEVIEHDPPRKTSFRGVDGPLRPVGTVTVEPVGEGSRLTLEFNLEGHGIGKLFAPLARMQAKKEIPKSHELLKQKLESGV